MKKEPEEKPNFADWGMVLRQDGLNSSSPPLHHNQENGIEPNI